MSVRKLLTVCAALVTTLIWTAGFQLVAQADRPAPKDKTPDYSGMYSFLKDGEFVQLTVEEKRVTGFVSRYGDTESDRGAFLDHFFKQGKLEGNQLTFATATVHGIADEFRGTVDRGKDAIQATKPITC